VISPTSAQWFLAKTRCACCRLGPTY
jgi:hypothetical protein